MAVDDPLAALNAIPGELRDTRLVLGKLQEEVQKDRRMIGWLRAACTALGVAVLVAVSWTAYQQAVIDSKSAAIAALVDQNAGRAAEQARNAHDLCAKLNRSRAVISGVWAQVQFRPGADPSALLAKVLAVESLGKCPKAPAGS